MSAALKFWFAQQLVGLGVWLAIVLLVVVVFAGAFVYSWCVNRYRKLRWRDRGYHWNADAKQWVKAEARP